MRKPAVDEHSAAQSSSLPVNFPPGVDLEIRKNRFLARRHLGFLHDHAALFHVRAHWRKRSASHHASRLFLRLRWRRSRLANHVCHYRQGSSPFPYHHDSRRPRKTRVLDSRHRPRSSKAHSSSRFTLRRDRSFTWRPLRNRLSPHSPLCSVKIVSQVKIPVLLASVAAAVVPLPSSYFLLYPPLYFFEKTKL